MQDSYPLFYFSLAFLCFQASLPSFCSLKIFFVYCSSLFSAFAHFGAYRCCIVSAVFREHEIIIPDGSGVIKANGHMVVVGKPEALEGMDTAFSGAKCPT